MTAQHTPGPWTLDATVEGWTLLAPDHWHDVCSFDATEEDARLIAAAPRMLEALRAALAYLESECPHESTDDCTSCALICYDARAAIRAATGEDA